ncbi:immunoglobulin kappa light chain-like isoform X1 [Megalobrama amblycephala]|uniref:immunoglobulin kappa light chain-like isoform X1 n=1 Tax=Megalobrama amblycephala TaxID=75352 RepID=UPI002013C536|nr:immunoglobulin kappa light chain-like isoform X1 [Megalobrama amblycephala]
MITDPKANMTLITIIIWTLTTCTWSSVGQTLTQSEAQTVQPDQTVTIHCNHKPAINCIRTNKYCMAWYHQIPGDVPKLLIYSTSDRASGVSSRFSGSESGNKMDFTLTISGVQPEDSGVYYCQSQHSKTGDSKNPDWVFTFGGGTRLSVGTATRPTLTVLPPSRDELQQGKATVVCVGSKGFPSDWKLSWKVDGSSRSSAVNLSPSVLQKDGLYSWSSSLSLTESEWSRATTISCDATHPSQNAVTESLNTQQCDDQ